MKPHFRFTQGLWRVRDPNGYNVLVDKSLPLLYFRWTIANNIRLSNFNKIEE